VRLRAHLGLDVLVDGPLDRLLELGDFLQKH
jgi:hypothetical protein